MMSGSGKYHIDDVIYNVKEGDLLIFNPGVKHQHIAAIAVKGDDTLGHANHVGGHTHAGFVMGPQGIQQIHGNGLIHRRCPLAGHSQKQRILHNGPNHIISSHPLLW